MQNLYSLGSLASAALPYLYQISQYIPPYIQQAALYQAQQFIPPQLQQAAQLATPLLYQPSQLSQQSYLSYQSYYQYQQYQQYQPYYVYRQYYPAFVPIHMPPKMPVAMPQCPSCSRGSRVIVYICVLVLAILLLVFASTESFGWNLLWILILTGGFGVALSIFL